MRELNNTRVLRDILIYLFVFVLFASCIKDNVENGIVNKNRVVLDDINMYEVNEKGGRSELQAERFVMDRSASEIYVYNGKFISSLKAGDNFERFELNFEKGLYDMKSRRLNLNVRGAILLDRDVRLSALDLEYDLESGNINTNGVVRISGNNFEFEAEGFSGNIKSGEYLFGNRIEARIFK